MTTARGLLIEATGQNMLRNSLLAGTDPISNWAAKVSGARVSQVSVLAEADGAKAWAFTATSQRPFFESDGLTLAASTDYVLSFWVEQLTFTGGNNVVAHVEGAGTGATGVDLLASAIPSALPARVSYKFRTGTGLVAGQTKVRIGLGCVDVATGLMAISRPQLELGQTMTSFMPGGADAVGSRAADLVTKATNSFPYNTAEGSWVCEFRSPRFFGAEGVIFQIDGGSEATRISHVIDATGHVRLIVTNGGTQIANLDGGAITADARHRSAIRYGPSDWALSVDGAAPVKSATGAVPAGVTTLRRGHGVAGRVLNSELSSLNCYRSRRVDATLQSDSALGAPPSPLVLLFAGTSITGHTIGNIRLLGTRQLSMRVVAPKTGRIASVTWYEVHRIPYPADGPSGSNYGYGTGGIVRTGLQTNIPGPNSVGTRNYPSGTFIGGSSNYRDWVHPISEYPSAGSFFRTDTLPVPASVTAGQIIHIVHRNVDPNPSYNYVSGDYILVAPTATGSFAEGNIANPVHEPVRFRVLSLDSGQWTYTVAADRWYYPVYQITYDDGDNFGMPWIAMANEGTFGITSTRWVRQSTIPYRTHVATHASVWVFNTSSTGFSLICEVRDYATGALLGTATHVGRQYSVADERGGWLVEAAFSPGPITFQAGRRYVIVWRATGGTYTSRGLQDGSVASWYPAQANRNPAFLPQSALNGCSEFSTNSTNGINGTWTGHTKYEKADRNDICISYWLRLR
jgi:hypothetical protein